MSEDTFRLENRITDIVEDHLYLNGDTIVTWGNGVRETQRYNVTDEIDSGPEAVLRRESDGAKFILTLSISVREYDR